MSNVILFLLFTFFISANVFAQNTDNVSKARTFIELLAKKDFQTAETYFSDEVKAQLSAAKLAEVLNSLTPQVGNFKRQSDVKSEKLKDFEIVVITVEYEKANLDFQMSFDKNGKIGGFFFRPSQTPSKNAETYKAPEYVRPDAFQEKEVTVGTGTEWALPATLTMPVGKGNFPVVALVHGSGANDRDESHINPVNKPFKDLAWGLASKGIAVLRYEKRTKQYGAKLATIKNPTVKEETVDDALAAIELLKKTPQIDQKKIFVLGHSLGGYLIPRIAVRDKQIAGFISLAGTTRPLEDVILEQNNYFAMLDGAVSKEEQSKLDQVKQISAQIKSLKESDINSSAAYLGIPASYWIDLKNYNPPQEAKSLKQPILILQGERDYQVTMTDFQNWKNALGKKKSVTFKAYPKLNHLFMPGEGTPSPADYEKTNHVSQEVIGDVADWILRQE
jgi:dienelactone hydrolase